MLPELPDQDVVIVDGQGREIASRLMHKALNCGGSSLTGIAKMKYGLERRSEFGLTRTKDEGGFWWCT